MVAQPTYARLCEPPRARVVTTVEGSADPAGFPEPVRSRVVSLTLDAMARLRPDQLPGPLRRMAAFTPAKRATLAAPHILAALGSDPSFRDLVADDLRAAREDEQRAEPVGVVDAAAAAYLLQSPGWAELLSACQPQHPPGHPPGQDETIARLQDRLSRTEAQMQRQRLQVKDQIERLKSENHDLRRKLGELRNRLRSAESDAETLRAVRETSSHEATRAASAAESEVRRLRARVSELESEVGATRRAERSERVSSSVRARLLLDTMSEAAHGLRRELGLPAVDRMPADLMCGEEPVEGTRSSTGHSSLRGEDPRVLEELLRLPRSHLVVDGYNVTKQAWPEAPLERQRDRLLGGLAGLLARVGTEVTVVFDAAATTERPLVAVPRGVRVRFSPFGVIADDVIRDLLDLEPPGRPVVVVTSDRALAADVAASGFRAVPAAALAALLARS